MKDTYTNKSGTITIEADLANSRAVHTNMFPVEYEELHDIPDDIVFRTNECIMSSMYCRYFQGKIKLTEEDPTIGKLLHQIVAGYLWKEHRGQCHSELATKSSVMTYLKYVKTGDVKQRLRVYNFDKLLEFEQEKTKARIKTEEELAIFNEIINLNSVKKGFRIISKIVKLENEDFQNAALLLLKCKVYDIEDKHYLETESHNKEEKECLKMYRITLFPQK